MDQERLEELLREAEEEHHQHVKAELAGEASPNAPAYVIAPDGSHIPVPGTRRPVIWRLDGSSDFGDEPGTAPVSTTHVLPPEEFSVPSIRAKMLVESDRVVHAMRPARPPLRFEEPPRPPPEHRVYGAPCFRGKKRGMPVAARPLCGAGYHPRAENAANSLFRTRPINPEYIGYQLTHQSFEEAGMEQPWWTPGSSVASTPRRLTEMRGDIRGVGRGQLREMLAARGR
eukprot:TRINITY_DN12201_c0_g1_i1.p1 TRINITY_DN12201_c0_g1~~TRINITY_DN12201_c0_g1_i1.p1  ORF type:complete len:229 (+),score=21.98 TRINITY_DN12201_c0_g1_i1:204-890(+)